MKTNPVIQNLAGNSFASFSAYFLHKLALPRQVIRLRARAGVFGAWFLMACGVPLQADRPMRYPIFSGACDAGAREA
jgi:hypothetical protein